MAGGPGTRGGETGGGTRVLPQTDLPSHQVPGRPGRVEGWGGGGDGTGSRGSLSEIQACVVERRSSLSRNLSSLSEFKIISANQHYLTQKKQAK